ncbi:MAG: peptidyl-prolyl cis-trans isomerase [Thermoleophilia bacterium]
MTQEKLAETIGSQIEVTDEDAQAYYDRNRIQYDQPERRQVRQIVTDNEATAVDAVRRARAGESFITLVEELSTDSQSSQKKGALGMVVKDQLQPELDAIVFNMKTGEISDPVKLGSQWYVFSLENIMPANLRTIDQVRDEIKRHYGAQKFSESWKKFGDDVRAAASIEYAPDYDPALKVEIVVPGEN